jgi:hypothetical protein
MGILNASGATIFKNTAETSVSNRVHELSFYTKKFLFKIQVNRNL